MKRVSVVLTDAQAALVLAALDSHQYWQIADEYDRRDGYVTGDSTKDPEYKACERLAAKIRAAQLAANPPKAA